MLKSILDKVLKRQVKEQGGLKNFMKELKSLEGITMVHTLVD